MLEEQVHDFGETLFNITKHAKRIKAMCQASDPLSKIQSEVHDLWVACANAHSAVVEQVQRKKVFPKYSFSKYSTTQNSFSTLSLTEQKVLEQLALRKADSEIASALGISELTVKTHIKNTRSKLDLVGCSRKNLIEIAQQFLESRENQPS
jgi:DNA-binding CsgD family transcriptional regulator